MPATWSILAVIIAGALLASCARPPAIMFGSRHYGTAKVQAIPARYDYRHPDMLVVQRSPGDVDRICRAVGARASDPGNKILGCAPIAKQRCAIVVPNDHPHKDELIRHEQAHCNGWAGHHPA